MLETNFRIVEPGVDLALEVRTAEVTGQDITPDLINKACDAIRRRYGLAAVPGDDASQILVASLGSVKQLKLDDKDWCLEVTDINRTRLLRFMTPGEAALLAQLYERGLMARLERETRFWTIKMFPRIFYEPLELTKADDIAAYARFEVSAEAIEEVGVGIGVELSTAFFTIPTVADFFREDLSDQEREQLQERFHRLRNRQGNRMGTLLYDNGKTRTTCYFDSVPPGTTAASTGNIMADGKKYSSLVDYYKQAHGINLSGNEAAAKVLFKRPDNTMPKKGLDRPVFVCAEMLRLRITNNNLPRTLKNVDKIAPEKRASAINAFWGKFNHAPLGEQMPKVSHQLWQPGPRKAFRVEQPDLLFAGNQLLRAPNGMDVQKHTEYFRNRQAFLDRYGCFDVPPAVKRLLHVAMPITSKEVDVIKAADDITDKLSRWVHKKVDWELMPYKSLDEAFSRLRQVPDPGIVLFIFDDDEGSTYYLVSHQLKDWRVKRITSYMLRRKAGKLGLPRNGDGRQPRIAVPDRAQRDWDSFVEMCALDVLQQMDCVPWTISKPLCYPAHLAIDVGEKHRHFAISLLICQPSNADPRFWLDTVPFEKVDLQTETINGTILGDAIVTVCGRPISRRPQFTPLSRLLVIRDGRYCGDEVEAILNQREELTRIGFLSRDAEIHVVNAHKNSVKGHRLWERSEFDGIARNALEGHVVLINRGKAFLTNTGAATLTQATAEPVVLETRDERVDIREVAKDFHTTSHFNYSSPSIAQRLGVVLKRTDDILKNRAAQEIKFLQESKRAASGR